MINLSVGLEQKDEPEMIIDEGWFGDKVFLCKSDEDAESCSCSYGGYGTTIIELTKDQLLRIINGEILYSSVQEEYSVIIKCKSNQDK